jgi:hypothetical protein
MDDKRQDREINEEEAEGDTVERKGAGQKNEILGDRA